MVVFQQEDRILIASGGTSVRHQMQNNLPEVLRQSHSKSVSFQTIFMDFLLVPFRYDFFSRAILVE